MTKSKKTPMTIEAAARIRMSEAQKNDGKIPAGGFGARADAAAQRHGTKKGAAVPQVRKTKQTT